MDFVPPKDGIFVSTMPVGPGQRRLALAVVAVATVLFLASAPFAKIQLERVDAFIPVYETALITFDLITAVLLFGQFAFLRSRAILVLASGYLFTSTMTLAHALSFPGLFSPQGLLGAGPQTTVWLYVFWHVGFTLFVLAFALLKNEKSRPYAAHRRARIVIAWTACPSCSRAYCSFFWRRRARLRFQRSCKATGMVLDHISSRWAAGPLRWSRLRFCCGADPRACLICGSSSWCGCWSSKWL